jgi:hypothetical protein
MADVEQLALEALENDYANLSQHTLDEKGHGRQEMRFAFVVTDLSTIRDRELWKDLQSLVCVVTSRTVNNNESNKTRYYISSRKESAEIFLKATRTHWSIENNWLWVLDVAFREDYHRLREGTWPGETVAGAQNGVGHIEEVKSEGRHQK